MAGSAPDWWLHDGVATTWFAAPSLVVGAELAARVLEVAPSAALDLRATGVRVRLEGEREADLVRRAARELGLAADAAGLQELRLVVESPEPAAVQRFWQPVLGYAADDGALVDPLRRDPPLSSVQATERRPLRQRLHLDVVRPAAVVEAVSPGEASGPFGVRHADPDGNEVDLVPGDALDERAADWQAVFAAVACYRTASPSQQRAVVASAADLAHDAGFALSVDVRPGFVVLDSGKDQWEADAHGLPMDFVDLAAAMQVAAREAGASADLALPRFVQLFLDAFDVDAVRACWCAALGYVPDARDGVSDVYDPRRLSPAMVFQPIDGSEVERRRQRGRTSVQLVVPPGSGERRAATALAAGGRLLDESRGRWHLADGEGNELVVVEV